MSGRGPIRRLWVYVLRPHPKPLGGAFRRSVAALFQGVGILSHRVEFMIDQSRGSVVTEMGGVVAPAFVLAEDTFERLRTLIYDLSGIHLKDAKRNMVQSRLTQRLRVLELTDFESYMDYLPGHPEELTDLVNRITTNKTYFFREKEHFRILRDTVLPYAAGVCGERTPITGWCAASSTGEEPYSIALMVATFLAKNAGSSARLLASDLDTNVLATAKRGIYPASVLSDLPRSFVSNFVVRNPDGEQGTFGLVPEVRNLLQFRRINLMAARFPIRSQLDFIFCRNVFIYFTREDRDNVVRRFIRVLKPGGIMFLGHSEVLDTKDFGGDIEFIGHTTYRKVSR